MARVVRLSDLGSDARRQVRAALRATPRAQPTVVTLPPRPRRPGRASMGVVLPTDHHQRPTPHDRLWAEVSRRWPDQAFREYPKMVPGRRIRGDIAFPAHRLVVEVDGWKHHGKYLKDFRRDRTRQNLLTIAGWRILRFAAGDIYADPGACCVLIGLALTEEKADAPWDKGDSRRAPDDT